VGMGDILRADVETGNLYEMALVLGMMLNTSDLAGRVASLRKSVVLLDRSRMTMLYVFSLQLVILTCIPRFAALKLRADETRCYGTASLSQQSI
jgi:hypothetical protein